VRASPDALPSIESILLQRLVAEIESRQLVRPQTTYVLDQPPARRQTALIRTLCGLVWVLSMAICIVTVKYIDGQSTVPQAGGLQSQAIDSLAASISDQKKEFSAMVDSLHVMTEAIASNSSRTAAISGVLNRFSMDLQEAHPPSQARVPVDLASPAAPPAQEADAALISMGGHHHAPLSSATVAPEGATVHYNALGVMDYWLVPRLVAGVREMVKVVPISQNNGASFVHDVAEAKDYILSPSGEWIAVLEPGSK